MGRGMSEQNKAIMRRVIREIMVEGNLDLVDELFTEDFVNNHGNTREGGGREGEKARIRVFGAAFPDLNIAVDDIVADGEMATARVTLTGTHQGDLGSIPATDKRVNVTGITMMRFVGSQVAEGWSVIDRLSMMQQLGVIPAS